MAEKGLIMDLVYDGKTYYLLLPGLIGFFEFTFMKQRQDLPVEELALLMHEYLFEDPENLMGKEMFARILKEKKRLTPFVIENVRRKIMKAVGVKR